MEDDNIDNDYCSLNLKESESDLELIEKSSALNQQRNLIVLYLWLRRSQGRNCVDENEQSSLPPESEFTIKLSRGKLKLPPINLYDLAQYYYAFFKARNPKCCTKIFRSAFQEIHEYTE